MTRLGPFDLPDSYVGDCRELLAQLPDESIQCCVTSPPYWGLRDYGIDGQLGLEETPEEFVENLANVFREVRRVLRGDGTLWLNLGDTYNSSPSNQHSGRVSAPGLDNLARQTRNAPGLKPKDLVGIPWSVAFALRANGWYLRSDIIWHKANPLPESVTDRPTKSHEYLFLLSKSPRYYYDAEALREEATTGNHHRNIVDKRPSFVPGKNPHLGLHRTSGPSAGRAKRSVWTIPTQPYPDAHFATFPEALVEPCILAGTPPKCCGTCGAPWQRDVVVSYDNPGNRQTNGPRSIAQRHEAPGFETRLERRTTTLGWKRGCEHQDAPSLPVVLDPFFGSGTVGQVAERHGRLWLGFDLNPEYKKLQAARTAQRTLPGLGG